MFNGTNNLTFKTDQPKAKVFELIEEELQNLGSVDISDRGMIKINASKFSGFAHETIIEGSIREKEGKYTIQLDYKIKLNTVGWLIGICTLPFGLAIFIFPILAKNEVSQKAESAFNNLRAEFK